MKLTKFCQRIFLYSNQPERYCMMCSIDLGSQFAWEGKFYDYVIWPNSIDNWPLIGECRYVEIDSCQICGKEK